MMFVGVVVFCCSLWAPELPGGDLFLAADKAQRTGLYDEACRLFQQCAEISEELKPYALSRSGYIHCLAGRQTEGQGQIERLHREFPEGPWTGLTSARLADICERGGDRQQAHTHYSRVLEGLDPLPWFLVDWSWKRVENMSHLPGLVEESRRIFRDIVATTLDAERRSQAAGFLLESANGDDRMWGIYGLVRSGNFVDARKCLDRERKNTTGALSGLSALESLDDLLADTKGDEKKITAVLETVAREHAASFGVRVWLMLVIREQALKTRFDTAEAAADFLARYFPEGRDGGDGYWWLSERYEKKEDKRAADRMYKRLVECCPAHVRAPRSLYNLANRARSEKRHEDAFALYDQLGKTHPTTSFAGEGYYRCAQMAAASKDSAREKEYLQRAAAMGAGHYYAHRARCLLLEKGLDHDAGSMKIRVTPSDELLAPFTCPESSSSQKLMPMISESPACRRLEYFGIHGLEEGEWEALALILNSPDSLKKLWYPVIAEAGFMHTLAQQMNAPGAKPVDGLDALALRRLEYPRAYWSLVTATAQELKMDPYLLLAVARQESTFRSGIASHAGAAGVLQLMPATANWLAGVDSRVTPEHAANLLSPVNSIRLGAVYMDRMLKRSQGNLVYALASYNAGPGNCDKWRARRGGQSLEAFIESIPFTETREYVQKVLANQAAYYSLYPPPDPGLGMAPGISQPKS